MEKKKKKKNRKKLSHLLLCRPTFPAVNHPGCVVTQLEGHGTARASHKGHVRQCQGLSSVQPRGICT